MSVCCTAECSVPATRTASWRAIERVIVTGPRGGKRAEWAAVGEPIYGRFCEECARRLWSGGTDVDPPFPPAKVLPFRGSTR